jgi:hypothetical protein
MHALYVYHNMGVYDVSCVCVCAVDEGDLFDGEVHPIQYGAEEDYREAEVHHVGHVCM